MFWSKKDFWDKVFWKIDSILKIKCTRLSGRICLIRLSWSPLKKAAFANK